MTPELVTLGDCSGCPAQPRRVRPLLPGGQTLLMYIKRAALIRPCAGRGGARGAVLGRRRGATSRGGMWSGAQVGSESTQYGGTAPWRCPGVALALPWRCPGGAPALPGRVPLFH